MMQATLTRWNTAHNYQVRLLPVEDTSRIPSLLNLDPSILIWGVLVQVACRFCHG